MNTILFRISSLSCSREGRKSDFQQNRGRSFSQILLYIFIVVATLAGNRVSEANPPPSAGNTNLQDAKVHQSEENQFALTLTDAVVLGLVEGLTEFLPISSTGHLILADSLLGLSRQSSPYGKSDQEPSESTVSIRATDEAPLTVKNAINAYIIIIQIGAIASVGVLYWSKLLSILRGILGRDRSGLLLGRNLALAFLPAALLGLAFGEIIEAWLFNHWCVTFALFAGAILMLILEYRRGRQLHDRGDIPRDEELDLPDMTPKQSIFIGLCQCVAMWPGTSRSMMVIVGGYLVGLNPRRAAEFSFLLGLITLSAAALYKGYKAGPGLLAVFGWAPMLLGCTVAAFTAALAVKWMIGYLTRHGLALFAYYRILLAIALLLLNPF